MLTGAWPTSLAIVRCMHRFHADALSHRFLSAYVAAVPCCSSASQQSQHHGSKSERAADACSRMQAAIAASAPIGAFISDLNQPSYDPSAFWKVQHLNQVTPWLHITIDHTLQRVGELLLVGCMPPCVKQVVVIVVIPAIPTTTLHQGHLTVNHRWGDLCR